MGFNELFYPEGIAVFGSVAQGKLGGILIGHLFQHGRRAALYAVNPKAAAWGDVPGYENVNDIPGKVDLAVIAAPAGAVADILIDCGKKGVKAAVIISSGFSEAGNAQGEEDIRAVVKKYGISFIGPNCAGLLNTHSDLAPTLQAYPPKGSTAVISQSGAVGGAIMEWAREQRLGISKFVSYGNGADLNQVEFLRYLKDDPETKVIAIYIENVEDGREFMAALRELAAVKPVVALKSGRTGTGQRAALSHTGSMAGSDAVYDAALRECGAIRVDSLDEMIDLCKGFQYLPPVQGTRVAIVTNSGGPGVMTADLAEQLGLDPAEPSAALVAELKTFLPAWAGFRNPVDMTVEGTGENYRRTIETLLREYDAALPIFFGPPYLDTAPVAKGMLDAFAHAGKPVVCAMETGLHAKSSIEYLQENGLPNFPSTERAIRVVRGMAAYEAWKKKGRIAAKPKEAAHALKGPVLEPEAMAFLRENGIPVPPCRFVETGAQVRQAADALGYPLAMKVVSPQIIHKSEFGGVKLHIQNADQAEAAFTEIAGRAQGHDFRGVMLYPMIQEGQEVIIGFTRDRQFGPVVAFGLGGIYTEVLKDIALRVAPVSKEGALEMMAEIKSFRILEGLRGQAGADLEALAELIARFSQLPFLCPDLEEADLNPVFAGAKGAIVGDVRLILAPAKAR